MSIWRTRRRHEENRRFNEQADAALLAIGVLRNRDDGLEMSYQDDTLRSQLSEGKKLLSKLRRGLTSPEEVDDYTYALSQQLCDNWRQVSNEAVTRLEEDIESLEQAEENLDAVQGIQRAETTLTDIEELAGKVSKSEAERLRSKLVG
ncbi:hypothetical protein Hlac_3232 [Halorubrum lacusprofundi ATCC 49239]|jgi:hypothetical protein|uniref:Uncharacterized protein n=1 Tax=Halorubrum lacusprofundi (strain ATCC 49239 / DSM 5036 / JCM 8891 / ACAM 34) TaxID=416348 RepID=B9LVQ0_HALLT|nr:hypothetical protein [Halorubrum lacusprofundi]ACM58763.1 hypothetical protein Hlac_3232 [Halorubrum lacusprofundi ATCC 49239]